MVWTVRLADSPRPHLWVTHEGKESAALVERHVAKCVAMGHTVIVGLSRGMGGERAPTWGDEMDAAYEVGR
jgi:hypothetical protein